MPLNGVRSAGREASAYCPGDPDRPEGERLPDPRRIRRARLSLIAVAALFLLPVASAWLVWVGPRDWLPESTTNRGSLVSPSVAVPPGAFIPIDGRPLPADWLEHHWTVLVWWEGPCRDACEQTLWWVRQAHGALGKDIPRVERLLIVAEPVSNRELFRWQARYPGFRVARTEPAARERIAAALARGAPAVLLLDPGGRVVLSYPPDAEPKALVRDLRRLLRISRIG